MASFSLMLTQSPTVNANHFLALDFATSLLQQGHSLKRVFFYQDAVYVGLNGQTPIQGQQSLMQQWLQLSKQYEFPLQLCIANAIRRGLVNAQEQERYQLPTTTVALGFDLVGLGELAEACQENDRVIQF